MKLPREIRHKIILDAAIRVANRNGLLHAYWSNVARECEVETAPRTIRAHFPRLRDMWDAVYRDKRFKGNTMGYKPT